MSVYRRTLSPALGPEYTIVLVPSKISQSGRYALVPQSTSTITNITMGEGDVMLFLSSDGPISVEHVTGQLGSILILGEMSTEAIAEIAEIFGAEFNGQKGV